MPVRFLLLLLSALFAPGQDAAARLAETALAFAEREASRLPGTWKVGVAVPPRVPPILHPGEFEVRPVSLSKREPRGRFFVVLDLWQDGRRLGQTRVDLEATWKGRLFRLKQTVPRRLEVTEDLVEVFEHEGVPPDGALLELPAGHRFRGPFPAGRILLHGDVEAIPLIHSGDPVRLRARGEGVEIRREVLARSQGGLGDRIRLEASGSRRLIYATVTGPGEAEVRF